MGEKGEEGAEEAADKGIDGNRGVGVESVAVDEIRHALPEGYHAANANKSRGKNGWDPTDAG